MFLWWGDDLIQFYNDAYRPSLGNDGKHPMALGQRGVECWPEIWPIIKPLIDQVLTKGEATWSEDQLIPIFRNGKIEDVYWTFGYSCIKDDDLQNRGVLVICNETTEKVLALKQLQFAKEELEIAQQEAERQRDRMKEFFMQAPTGICILDGPSFVYELVNPPYQELFPDRELLGRPVSEAVPEILDQPIWPILNNVYNSGETFEGKEVYLPVYSSNSGKFEDRFFNFIYQARHDFDGNVDGILVFVFEVTEMVNVRNEMEKARETLRLALESAEVGTFDYDVINDVLVWDERCRRLFNIYHNNPVNLQDDFVGNLHPDDRAMVKKVLHDVFDRELTNGEYNLEYRVIDYSMNIRWVSAKGKVYFDDNDKPLRFIGTALDITERKSDEIRKNDFIAMVSHELKTPLTSLKAYVQLLQSRSNNYEDKFSADAFSKMNNQVVKMSTLINGFLNVSRLESGKITLEKSSFDISVLIQEIVYETSLLSPTHIIEIGDCKPLVVLADREKIGSVVSNLLTNGVKYSERGKKVIVNCREVNGEAVVSVTDEGIGIGEEEIERLFDRFYRVENLSNRHISGFGIGLYLSAEIIKIHKGRIWVESKEGVGSVFSFSLPVHGVS
jgi:signal transduction histidine kinase